MNQKNNPVEGVSLSGFFILGVVMLALIGLLGGDKLVYLRLITPEVVATIIMIGGMLGFIGKLILWRFFPEDEENL